MGIIKERLNNQTPQNNLINQSKNRIDYLLNLPNEPSFLISRDKEIISPDFNQMFLISLKIVIVIFFLWKLTF